MLVTVDNQEHTNQSLELTNVDTKSQEDLKRVICQKMNVFELDEDCISHLQYYNQKFCQYLLLKDMTKIQDGVKINVRHLPSVHVSSNYNYPGNFRYSNTVYNYTTLGFFKFQDNTLKINSKQLYSYI